MNTVKVAYASLVAGDVIVSRRELGWDHKPVDFRVRSVRQTAVDGSNGPRVEVVCVGRTFIADAFNTVDVAVREDYDGIY